jgi:hypothetical protein
MDGRTVGLLVVAAGIVVVLVGVLIAAGGLGWIGRLPGDIRVERENVRVYVPLASMLLISGVLSLLLALLRRWF